MGGGAHRGGEVEPQLVGPAQGGRVGVRVHRLGVQVDAEARSVVLAEAAQEQRPDVGARSGRGGESLGRLDPARRCGVECGGQELLVLRVEVGRAGVEPVLRPARPGEPGEGAPEREHDVRVSQPGDLPEARRLGPKVPGEVGALTGDGGPDADHRIALRVAVQGEFALGELEHQGTDVERRERSGGGQRAGHRADGAGREEAEHPAVGDERLGDLARQGPAAARQGAGGLAAQRPVVGHQGQAGVGGRGGAVGDQRLGPAVPDPLQGVALLEQQRAVLEGTHGADRDRSGAEQSPLLVPEGPPVGGVRLSGAPAVDVQLVPGPGGEGVVQRPGARELAGLDIDHDGHPVVVVRAGEGVHVGEVRLPVGQHGGRVEVTAGLTAAEQRAAQRGGGQDGDGTAEKRSAARAVGTGGHRGSRDRGGTCPNALGRREVGQRKVARCADGQGNPRPEWIFSCPTSAECPG